MKVIMVDKRGNESLVCESIDQFHGSIFVSLMNGNYSSKVREVTYKMVELGYVMNEQPKNWEQTKLNLGDVEKKVYGINVSSIVFDELNEVKGEGSI